MSTNETSLWSSQRVWIIGCGDVGWRLARRLADAASVSGFRRNPLRVLPTPHFAWFKLDLDQALTALPMPTPSIVYYLAPPPSTGQTDPRLKRFLERLPAALERLIYVSTTAVYGDHEGAQVNETTVCRPSTERGLRRLDAEEQIQQFGQLHATPWNILRVPGIYGPDRLPVLRLKAGAAVPDPVDTGPGNRIHVADLVSALVKLAEKPVANDVFNISDQNPIPNAQFLSEVAAQLGLAAPAVKRLEELKADMSSMQESFLSERRLIDSSKLYSRLEFVPQFADYKLGIQQSLEASRSATKV